MIFCYQKIYLLNLYVDTMFCSFKCLTSLTDVTLITQISFKGKYVVLWYLYTSVCYLVVMLPHMVRLGLFHWHWSLPLFFVLWSSYILNVLIWPIFILLPILFLKPEYQSSTLLYSFLYVPVFTLFTFLVGLYIKNLFRFRNSKHEDLR